jgi:peptide deformylase
MTARPCLRWPHPVLRRPAAPVGQVTDDIRRIWDDMIDTMEAMPGYGLAAPQIGVSLRLAVVDCSTERGQPVRMADPVLLEASTETYRHIEASPNLPGVHAELDRPRRVRVGFLNREGEREERAFQDLWATSVQHQLDHLEGRMFFDRLGPMKRRMLIAKAEKQARA